MNNQRLVGLFVNTARANCSIYESGYMMYRCLRLSEQYIIDYLEIDEKHHCIPGGYDFYAFNYHHATMGWLDTASIRRLPGLRLTFVLETLPNDPFVLCPNDAFDVYCAIDPTMDVEDKRVYAFPRPLEVFEKSPPPISGIQVPVIGSFGFATPGKGFDLVVEAVNREFEEAIVRINIPPGTYADDPERKNAKQMAERCINAAKEGVKVLISEDYLSKDELIKWCADNTLNCFLYTRNQPGLSATTDQAIASGRPLAVSSNETFRHIHQYMPPYPKRSLRESIKLSLDEVQRMKKDWAPENFAKKFNEVLVANFQEESIRTNASNMIRLKARRKPILDWIRIAKSNAINHLSSCNEKRKKKDSTDAGELAMTVCGSKSGDILILSHKEQQCGIYQYGINISSTLSASKKYSFKYVECSSANELFDMVRSNRPSAIIYNYYPATMPWLNESITARIDIPQFSIMHEVTQEEADRAKAGMFDFYLCPDPTIEERNPIVYKTRRLIPSYRNTAPESDVPIIGSFGFGFPDKGFERIIQQVQVEFDEAKIFFHMPFNDVVDKDGKNAAIETAMRCRRILKKPGIELVINHSFLTKERVLDFLAGNTINAFFYDERKYRGISSVIDYALAVRRPIAITRCGMFRHVLGAKPSICIEDASIREIIANGIKPLEPFYSDWSEESFIRDYENILDDALSRYYSRRDR